MRGGMKRYVWSLFAPGIPLFLAVLVILISVCVKLVNHQKKETLSAQVAELEHSEAMKKVMDIFSDASHLTEGNICALSIPTVTSAKDGPNSSFSCSMANSSANRPLNSSSSSPFQNEKRVDTAHCSPPASLRSGQQGKSHPCHSS